MIDAALAENHTFENAQALARGVAEWLCDLAQASDRAFAVCLSGGSTPPRLYELLATPEIASRFPFMRGRQLKSLLDYGRKKNNAPCRVWWRKNSATG